MILLLSVQPDMFFFLSDEKDIRDVYTVVRKLQAKYYQLGVFFGLPCDKLENIKLSCNQELDKALIETLKLWLRQEHDTKKHGLPSWRILVQTVSMVDALLASEIAAMHPKGIHNIFDS